MRATPRAWRRSALGAALLAGALAALMAPSAPSAASAARSSVPDGACVDTDGVTVVVDFGTLPGGVNTRCAQAPVSTGYDALRRVGFAVEGTEAFPGLLCRIDGKPVDDPCQRAPKADYYWAYWTASSPGGAWTYSQEGAATRKPPPGSVEGWAFSDGCTRKPGASTTCLTATTTTPTTSSSPTTSPPVAPEGAKRTGGASVTIPAGSGTTAPEGTDAPSAPDATDGAAALPSADDDRGGDLALEDRQDAVARGPAKPDSGSPAGVIVGAVAVGALCLAGSNRLRRRRRATLAGSAGE